MSTLAGRRGMRPKMMMPFDTQPPQRKCLKDHMLIAFSFSVVRNDVKYNNLPFICILSWGQPNEIDQCDLAQVCLCNRSEGYEGAWPFINHNIFL